MTAPTEVTWFVPALVAAHTAFRDCIDSGSGAGFVRIRSGADVLLGTIPMTDPCGTVSATTGQLLFSFSGPDTSADANNTAAYGEFCSSDGTVWMSLPCQAGSVAVSGYLVLSTLTTVVGKPIEILSATIG